MLRSTLSLGNRLQRQGSDMTWARATRWNRAIDERRGFASLSMPLGQVRDIARDAGVKVNDVVLAVTSAALDRHLERLGQRKGALIGACPVSLRARDDASMNNQVSMIAVNLCRDTTDPRARIQEIHHAATVAKGNLAAAADLQSQEPVIPFLPAVAQRATAAANPTLINLLTDVPASLVVSNVPGPRETVYVAGAKMLTSYPMSIVTHGAGLNVTVCSYADQLELGLTVASSAIDDVQLLRSDFQVAWEALVEAFRAEDAADQVRAA